ncbi:MAG: ribonuclease J [Synergistaceae bacterium]|nr:ribonuclease J [Synergistaceae bacterium]
MNPKKILSRKKGSKENRLSFIPLGGAGEIGKNMYVIEYGDDILVIDAGLKFADQSMPGIDFIVPDISYLEKNREKILGIVLTHGHEDHIGALTIVLPRLNVPLYGTPLTLGMVCQKFNDELPNYSPTLNEIHAGETVDIGPFTVRFMSVTHSIPDGVGLSIETPLGRILHSGDFKLDSTPIDDRLTDYAGFAEEGKKGVLLLLSDSTNAERSGFTPSESVIGGTLERIFRSYRSRRIIISAFASNLHRVQQVLDAAAHFNRKVVFLGRSMMRNTELAASLGYLDIDKRTIIPVEDIDKTPDNQLVIMTTGSQGEPFSGLVLMSRGEHRMVKLGDHDVVLLLASAIPGNEKLVNNTINRLFDIGCEVIYEEHDKVHVSGHASSEELKMMLNIIKPKYFVPIHGESRHLFRHTKLASDTGVPNKNIFILQNGDALTFDKGGKAPKKSKVSAGSVMINSNSFDQVSPSVIKERLALGEEGIVIVSATLSKRKGLVFKPSIMTRGFLFQDEQDDFIEEGIKLLEKLFKEILKKYDFDVNSIEKRVKMSIREHIRRRSQTSPVILPVISIID